MKSFHNILSGDTAKLHTVFCAAVLSFLFLGMYLLYILGFRFNDLASAFADCFLFVLSIYTGRWLCLRWYLAGKLLPFVCCTALSVFALAILKLLLVKYVFGHSYAGFFELFRDVMPFFVVGLVMGMLLKLIRFSMQKELQDAQIKSEQQAMEFNLLQAQLSPHFLFNVLNNLYGISIAEHQRIPALLLKLSELLRYAVYSTKKTFVPLKDEIAYIRNYIEFEQIRVSDRLIIRADIEEINNPNVKIAPLILITFIENAFKHSKNSLSQNIWINVSLNISGNFIRLAVSNSCGGSENNDGTLDEHSGLGLANTLKRLTLLYGNEYEFKQNAGKDEYRIELNLPCGR